MLTFFHSPGSFSSRIAWLLEELQASCRVIVVPAGPGAPVPAGALPGDPPNPHPHGYAPALVHDGHVVTESGAIALYLTDLHPSSPIGVPPGHTLRGAYLSWLFYQVGVAEPLYYMKGAGLLASDPPMAALDRRMAHHIEDTLRDGGPYLLGDRFTAADVLFMSLFDHARALLPRSEVLARYLALADRPARQRALQWKTRSFTVPSPNS